MNAHQIIGADLRRNTQKKKKKKIIQFSKVYAKANTKHR